MESIDFTTISYSDAKPLFTNMGKPWTKDEDTKLIYEYNVKKHDIITICTLHKRMPGGILSRLRHNKLITEVNEARGYDIWITSKLYNEPRNTILEKSDTSCATGAKDSSKVTKKMLREQRFREIVHSELETLKNDIKEIKDSIKSLTDMLKAIYEFEEVEEA